MNERRSQFMKTKKWLLGILFGLMMALCLNPSLAFAEGLDSGVAGSKPSQAIQATHMSVFTNYTGKNLNARVVEGNGALSYAVKSGRECIDVGTDGALTFKKAGTAYVTVTAAETDTYAETSVDVPVKVYDTYEYEITFQTVQYAVGTMVFSLNSLDIKLFDKDGTEVGSTTVTSPRNGGRVTVRATNFADKVEMTAHIQDSRLPSGSVTLTGSGGIGAPINEWNASNKVFTCNYGVNAPEPEYTPPVAKTNLTANGSNQILVHDGSVSVGGVIQYCFGTESKPDAVKYYDWGKLSRMYKKEAGTYYVWWRIHNTDNGHSVGQGRSELGPQCIKVTIGKGTISPTVNIEGWTYGETAKTPTVTGNTGNGAVTYEYKAQDADDSTYSTTVPTDAGEYTVRASVAETGNFAAATATADFTISKAEQAAPDLAEKTYTGQPQTASVPESAYYDLVENAGGTAAGSYPVVLRLKDPANYRWTDADEATKSLVFRILPAGVTEVDVPELTGLVYDPARTLADVPLSGGWAWKDGTMVPTVNTDFYEAVLAVDDLNYDYSGVAGYDAASHTLTRMIYLTVQKAVVNEPAIQDKHYTGSPQVCDVPASALYTVEENNGGTETGEYPVVLKLTDPDNYRWLGSAEATETLTFRIVPVGTNIVTVSLEGWMYGESPKAPVSTASYGGDTVTYTYAAVESGDYVSAVPTEAGVWFVKARVEATADYGAGEDTARFEIAKAPSAPAQVTANSRGYDGTEHPLVTVNESSLVGGTMLFALGNDADTEPANYAETIPTAVDAGTYTVWYFAKGDANHSDSKAGCVSVSIKGRALSSNMTKVEPAAFLYDGNSHGPAVTVMDGGILLTAGKDYTVTGTTEAADISTGSGYAMTVTGTGNYSGSVTETWMIKEHTTQITAAPTASAISWGKTLADSQLTDGTVVDEQGNAISGVFAWSDNAIRPAISDSNQKEYEVTFKPDNDQYPVAYCTVKVTVNRAEATVTAPTGRELTYNGQAQALVTGGTAAGGTMVYALGTADGATGEYTAFIPEKTDAGTWFVWYYAKGDENHSDSKAACVSIAIKPKALSSNMTKVEPAAFLHDGASHGPTITVTDGETQLTAGKDYIVTGTTEATDISTGEGYTITVTGTGNYSGSVTETWMIKEYITTVTSVPAASAITYGQSLADSVLTGGSVTDQNGKEVSGVFVWSDGTIQPASSDSDHTEYEVTFRPDSDQYPIAYSSVKLTVNRAEATVTAPTARELTCNGQAQELVGAGSAAGGTLTYAIGEDADNAPATGWSTAIPTGTDAGTYYVWYKAAGDENHLDTAAASLTVTIAEAETQKADEGGKTTPEKIIDGLYQDPTLGWVLLEGGEIRADYTGLYNDATYGLWFVRSGKIDWTFTGLYNDAAYGWQLIHEGTICRWYNGLFFDQTYGWWLVQDGAVSFGYNGLWNDPNCGWWLIKGGAVDFSFTGLHYEEEYGWRLIHQGAIAAGYNGFYYDTTYGWWLIRGGTIAFDYNGLCYDMNYGWWLIKDGTIDFSYNGLVNDPNCGWWLINGGRVAFDYTGLYYEAQYGWWLIKGGTVAFDYNGLCYDVNCGWWLIRGGTVAFDTSGLYCDTTYGWWLIRGGAVAFDYSGLCYDATYGWWLIRGGTVDFGYNGLYDDTMYGSWLIKEGRVAFE